MCRTCRLKDLVRSVNCSQALGGMMPEDGGWTCEDLAGQLKVTPLMVSWWGNGVHTPSRLFSPPSVPSVQSDCRGIETGRLEARQAQPETAARAEDGQLDAGRSRRQMFPALQAWGDTGARQSSREHWSGQQLGVWRARCWPMLTKGIWRERRALRSPMSSFLWLRCATQRVQ